VLDFRIYSDRSKILFSAVSKTSSKTLGANPIINSPINPLEQKLYTVNLNPNSPSPSTPQLILDSGDYQNFKFDLSADGKAIVVQRLSRLRPGQYGLWAILEGEQPKSLENQPGGDFLITPDSDSVAIAQGEGVAILPLTAGGKPLDFLPKFGMVLNFSKDGSEAVMVKFNKDYTRSLFRVTNQGVQTEILKTKGSILSAQFDRQKQNIYGIFTEVIQTATSYQEQPYIGVINLKNPLKNPTKIATLQPWQRDTQLSLAPDLESGLLFDLATERSPNPFAQDSKIIYTNLRPKHTLNSTQSSDKIPCPLSNLSCSATAVGSLVDTFPQIKGSRPQWLP
jgi:hypothetical protein